MRDLGGWRGFLRGYEENVDEGGGDPEEAGYNEGGREGEQVDGRENFGGNEDVKEEDDNHDQQDPPLS